MSDYRQSNVGSGMVAHKASCNCDECTVDRQRAKIATLQARIKELEAENAQARRTSQFHKDNHRVAGARLALLEKSNTTMKEAHEHILEYWNRDENDGAMADALWHIIETSAAALQAAVYLQEPAP